MKIIQTLFRLPLANSIAPPRSSSGANQSFRNMEFDLYTRPASVLYSVMQADWPGFLHILEAIKPLQKSHHNITCLRQCELFYGHGPDVSR